ncbi:MAG TPA: hypothetical protein VLM79_30820 [Kofleriaceae bacterium]|nr:hypothetical protein [Kofleriaceae bacterium]
MRSFCRPTRYTLTRGTLTRTLAILTVCAGCGSSSSSQSDAAGNPDGAGGGTAADSFSFFITGAGNPKGGDFRLAPGDIDGFDGADAFCQTAAARAGAKAAAKQWRAYLSSDTLDARDRIGTGPWFNFKGDMIAASVEALHDPASNMLNKQTGLTETGATIPGAGDPGNQHDIITGSKADGTTNGNTCNNWTSSDASVTAQLGHFDRMGGGQDPTSWNSAHASMGCAAISFPPTGGRGSIYCFALVDTPF